MILHLSIKIKVDQSCYSSNSKYSVNKESLVDMSGTSHFWSRSRRKKIFGPGPGPDPGGKKF